jgi:glycine/D-amino acid oxidase-like deaminating enzyme
MPPIRFAPGSRRPDALTDAIVVGAGIVGAACAYYLAREGLAVTVMEAEFAGFGTTAAGMGHVVVLDDDPLSLYSQNLLRALDPPDIGLDRCGTLWVAETDDQLSAASAKRGAEVLDERALREAEPALRPGLAGALLVRDDFVVYQPALTRWLLDRSREAGAIVKEHTRVDRLDALKADAIVNAAGAWAPSLTPGLPIIPRKGHLVVTDRVPGLCRHQVAELGYVQSAKTLGDASVAFNVQPRPRGQVLIGSSRELVGWDASINHDVLRRMVRRAVEFMPALADVTALRVWTGFRPATPDHRPFVGTWPHTPGLWIAAGHEGLGITMALGTGRLLTDLILGRTPTIDPLPYSPARIA